MGKGVELLTLDFDVREETNRSSSRSSGSVLLLSLTEEGDLIPFDAIIDNFELQSTTICRARGFVSHTNREHFIHSFLDLFTRLLCFE